MEIVTTADFSNLKDNKIICENCKIEFEESSIEFSENAKGNIIYFQGETNETILLEECEIVCKGDNNLIFINASKFPLKLAITLGHGCSIYIGKNLYSTTPIYMCANEKSNVYIGEWGLFARNIWIRTSDMHMLFDANTKRRINPNKDVYIGEHVWLGQDVRCLKGTVIGDGSFVGQGSICTNDKTGSVNALYVGRPASLVREDIMWRHKGTNQVTEAEFEAHTYDIWENDKYIYDNDKMKQKLNFYKSELASCDSMNKKIEFFKSRAWNNQKS